MAPRPASPWEEVGGDPVAGDAEGFALWARRFKNCAGETAEAAAELRRIIALADDGMWVGEAADAFRHRAGHLLERLNAESEADAAASEALFRFGASLNDLQVEAQQALEQTVGPAAGDSVGQALQGTEGLYGFGPMPGDPDFATLARSADDLRERVRAAEDRTLWALDDAVPRFALLVRAGPGAGIPPPALGSISERASSIRALCEETPGSPTAPRHLAALMADAASKADRDPSYGTALLIALGVDGIRQILARAASLDPGSRRPILGPLGALLVLARRSTEGRAVVDGLISPATWRLDLLATDALVDTDTAVGIALVLLKCEPGEGQLHLDPTGYQRRALEFLAGQPDLAIRYAYEHTEQLMIYLGLPDARGEAAAAILAAGLGGPLTRAQRAHVDATLERVMAAMAEDSWPAPPGKRVISSLLAQRLDAVAIQAGIPDVKNWSPGVEPFGPPRSILHKVIVQLVDDPVAHKRLEAGVTDYTAHQFADAAVYGRESFR